MVQKIGLKNMLMCMLAIICMGDDMSNKTCKHNDKGSYISKNTIGGLLLSVHCDGVNVGQTLFPIDEQVFEEAHIISIGIKQTGTHTSV